MVMKKERKHEISQSPDRFLTKDEKINKMHLLADDGWHVWGNEERVVINERILYNALNLRNAFCVQLINKSSK